MPKLFNPDSPIQSFLSDILDLALLNLITIICAAPIITAGASFGAMNHVILEFVLDQKPIRLRDFFSQFRVILLRASLSWGALIVVVLVYLLNLQIVVTMPAGIRLFFVIGLNFFLFCALLTSVSLFPRLSSETQIPLLALWKKSFLLSVAHLPAAFLMILIQVVPVALFLLFPSTFLALLPAWLLIWFTLSAFVCIKIGKHWLISLPAE